MELAHDTEDDMRTIIGSGWLPDDLPPDAAVCARQGEGWSMLEFNEDEARWELDSEDLADAGGIDEFLVLPGIRL